MGPCDKDSLLYHLQLRSLTYNLVSELLVNHRLLILDDATLCIMSSHQLDFKVSPAIV